MPILWKEYENEYYLTSPKAGRRGPDRFTGDLNNQVE